MTGVHEWFTRLKNELLAVCPYREPEYFQTVWSGDADEGPSLGARVPELFHCRLLPPDLQQHPYAL